MIVAVVPTSLMRFLMAVVAVPISSVLPEKEQFLMVKVSLRPSTLIPASQFWNTQFSMVPPAQAFRKMPVATPSKVQFLMEIVPV